MKRLVKGIKQPPPKWQQVESSRKIPFFIVHTWIAFVWLGIESRPNFKLECDIPCHCNVSCMKSIITKLCLGRFQILSLKYWCYVFLYFCQLFRVNENMDVVIIRHHNSDRTLLDDAFSWPMIIITILINFVIVIREWFQKLHKGQKLLKRRLNLNKRRHIPTPSFSSGIVCLRRTYFSGPAR